MSCSKYEPQLTAYVLDELDEPTRREVQSHIEGCQLCRAEVESIRETTTMLATELAPRLSEEQRSKIFAAAETNKFGRALRFWQGLLAGSLAATLVIGVALWAQGAGSCGDNRQAAAPTRPGWSNEVSSYDSYADFDAGGNKLKHSKDATNSIASLDASGNVPANWRSQPGTALPITPSRPISEESSGRNSITAPTGGTLVVNGVASHTGGTTVTAGTSSGVPSPVVPGGPVGASVSKRGNDVWHELTERRADGRYGKWAQEKGGKDWEKEPLSRVRESMTADDTDEFGGSHDRQPGFNTEGYDLIVDNVFLDSLRNPLSTFSIDVDTASYSNTRRMLNNNQLPPAGAVRIEELVNYFSYDYPSPDADQPFSANIEIAGCPWQTKHRLVRIGLKGRDIAQDKRPVSNLVFLLDVSGSMMDQNKLPLVKEAMKLLVNQLTENDRVSIAVYAGAAGKILDPTPGDNKQAIVEAIERLSAGGSTAGAQGIKLAYELAANGFIKGGCNRVILCTDGDFNVGMSSDDELVKLIEEKAKSGVFLTVLGFGMGNLKDSKMEKLADKGNGNYAYIDNINEAKKVLVEQMSGTLVTIAKDVKIQVEFNPKQVAAYRLIGYENRMLRAEDFNDDTKDAGEIGAGHQVTALYEVVPAGEPLPPTTQPEVDPLKYQVPTTMAPAADSGEMLTLKLRHKAPDGDVSKLIQFPARDAGAKYSDATRDFKFAASVAAFGMILRDSKFKGTSSFDMVAELAGEGKGPDKHGYRAEFIELIGKAKSLRRN